MPAKKKAAPKKAAEPKAPPPREPEVWRFDGGYPS